MRQWYNGGDWIPKCSPNTREHICQWTTVSLSSIYSSRLKVSSSVYLRGGWEVGIWGSGIRSTTYEWILNGEPMPKVSETMHLGIMQSTASEQSSVKENIQKARSENLIQPNVVWSPRWERAWSGDSDIHCANLCHIRFSVWNWTGVTETKIHGHARKK